MRQWLLADMSVVSSNVLGNNSEESSQEAASEPPVRRLRGLNVLCYVIFLGTFEWGMVIPTLFPLLRRMEAPDMYFGLIIGTFSLTRMICQPLIGALGDRFDFKVLLCSCLACSALGGVLYAVAEAAWFLLMSRIICGIGASVTPLLFAWTARALTGVDEVAQAQVRLNTLRSLGTTIGPFSSTILAVLPQEGLFNELNSAGWAIAIVNLFGLLLVWRFLDDIPPVPKVTTNDIEQNKAKDTAVWTNPVLWICLLFQVVTALLLAILEVIPPIVLTTQFGMPPSATSVLFGIVSLVILAVFAVTAAIGSRISRRSLMCLGVGSIFAGGLWAEFGWTTGAKLWEFIVLWVILATAHAPLIRTPARAVYTSHLPISIQGVMQGISESAFSLANFLGPILGSYVAEEGGLPGLRFLMLLLVSVECSLLIVGFTRLVPGEELQ